MLQPVVLVCPLEALQDDDDGHDCLKILTWRVFLTVLGMGWMSWSKLPRYARRSGTRLKVGREGGSRRSS